jgi:hypothetical protein
VGGLMDFLTPGGGAASMVDGSEDSVEEMFFDKGLLGSNNVGEKPGTVKLVFPLRVGEAGFDDEWLWDLCGGLIGGARGNRFCTKVVKGNYPHCGVASHATHKAASDEGNGYIPSVNDRSGTESAFLDPPVAASRHPNSIEDLAGQALSHEEWHRNPGRPN